MKILVLSQHFWPESFIINNIVHILGDQGHEVVVATGKPNYPDGKVFEGYRAWGTQREHYSAQVEIVRVPLWPRGSGGAKNLALNYLSFIFSALFFLPLMLRKREFDAILVFATSPLLQAIPAIPLKWLKQARLVLWVQDLWPESLAATGFIHNRHLLRVVGWVVRVIYHYSDSLLVQSRAFIGPVSKYADSRKITYFPNSAELPPVVAEGELPEELNTLLDQNFCIVFAGNLGTAQALDTLVQTAVALKDEEKIRLVLVGSGSRLEWLKAQKQAYELDNLVLPGRFPVAVMPQLFEKATALLVSLNNEEIFSQTIPSKVQAYLAAGRPILASMNGEGARVIREAEAGFTSPAEQAAPLVANIRKMLALGQAERDAMGASGRAYFDAHFEMNKQCAVLLGHLTGPANERVMQ